MPRFIRMSVFFSVGIGISLVIAYWLKQEEARNHQRLRAKTVSTSSLPETHIVLSNKTLDAAESRDDLTMVHGIGVKTADALHAVGITTYAALASASAPDMLQRLQNTRGINIEKITRWIQEAKEMEA